MYISNKPAHEGNCGFSQRHTLKTCITAYSPFFLGCKENLKEQMSRLIPISKRSEAVGDDVMAYLHSVSTRYKAGQTVFHSLNAFTGWAFPEFFRMSLTIASFCLFKVSHYSMSNVSFRSILPCTHTQLLSSSMESLCQSKTCLP